jgi:hypothetical protein
LTQAPSTTTTKIHPNSHKCHKTQQSLYLFPYPTPLFPSSFFSATFNNYPNFYISSLLDIETPPTPTVCRYYHQGVFYVICKQLVWYKPVNLLLLN